MKRVYSMTFEKCSDCPSLKHIDGYAKHCYECPDKGFSVSMDGSNECLKKFVKQTNEWFATCKRWNKSE